MTIREQAELLGKRRLYRIKPGVWVGVRIQDFRTAFGRIDALVAPIDGEGETWVEWGTLRVPEEEVFGS